MSSRNYNLSGGGTMIGPTMSRGSGSEGSPSSKTGTVGDPSFWMAGARPEDPVAATARPYYQLLMRVITNG